MDVSEPPNKRRKMVHTAHPAAVPVTAYRYSEKNVFSLLLQSDGMDIPLIYNSQYTFAALDKYPLARGHALLIVKHPAATLLDPLPPAVAQATMEDLQALVRAVQAATSCTGLRVTQACGPAAGQTVPQLHFHIIPVYESSDLAASPAPASAAPAPSGTGPREALAAADAGPLLAHIRNTLPENYAPGYHVWAATEAEMEALGWALQQACSAPGAVLALSGHLGAGKSTISRGFVRAFVRDPLLEVPSPTFLLCLSYQDDTAYDNKVPEDCTAADAAGAAAAERPAADSAAAGAAAAMPPAAGSTGGAAAAAAAGGSGRARCVHHMDPYRLGAKSDKMAGLIDFDAAFRREVCLIEWPDKMPSSVMGMAEQGLAVDVSGMGAQASGRLVTLTPLGDRFKPPPPRSGKAGKAGGGGGAKQQPPQQQAQQQQQTAAQGATSDVVVEEAADGAVDAGTRKLEAGQGVTEGPKVDYAGVLRAWRRDYPASPPPVDVAWRGGGAATAGGDVGADALAGSRGAAAGAVGSTINAAAAAVLAAGDPSQWVVLGIESSCDDTAAAVVRGDGTVLSHQIASQTGLHEQYGGVKPDVARQAHADAIQATVDSALEQAGVGPGALTAVAVTAGPGLALCLQVGVQYGLQLAARHGLPYIPVHHMEAHAMMTRLPTVNENPMQFPSLLLLVSGGHNMLVLCEGVGRHRIVGTTLDDSVGECFDKIARVAGITAVPGGPHLERLAAAARPDAHVRYPLTMPLSNGAQRDSCNFSFSGLKTQVMTLITLKRKELGLPELPPPPALAAAAAATAAATAATAAGDANATAIADADGEAAEAGATAGVGVAAAAAAGDGGAAMEAPSDGAKAGPGAEAEAEAAVSEEELSQRAAAEADFSAAVADIAASFQRMAVRFLQQRTRRALEWLRQDAAQQLGTAAAAGAKGAGAEVGSDAQQQQPHQPGFVRSLVVAGGVAANSAVRAGLSEVAAEFGLPCVYPPVRYCTDNGLMVAWTGVERLKMGLYQQPPRGAAEGAVDAHVQVIPRWPIGPMDPRSTANKGRAHIKILH